ncbi:MAG TPA: cache domain-containing protein [Kiritimatiellia bacterium]|jgi:hypothetical protein
MNVWRGVSAALLAVALSASAQTTLDKVVVNAAASLVDERLESVLTTLEALAVTREIQSVDWDTIQPILAKYQADVKGAVWYAQTDGTYFTAQKGRQAQSLADRRYFPRVLDGERAVGELVTSRSTGRHVVVAAVPILKGGRVIGILGASLYLDELSKAIETYLGLPEDVSFMAVSPEGKVALHSDPDRLLTDFPLAEDAPAATSALTGWRFVVEDGK